MPIYYLPISMGAVNCTWENAKINNPEGVRARQTVRWTAIVKRFPYRLEMALSLTRANSMSRTGSLGNRHIGYDRSAVPSSAPTSTSTTFRAWKKHKLQMFFGLLRHSFTVLPQIQVLERPLGLKDARTGHPLHVWTMNTLQRMERETISVVLDCLSKLCCTKIALYLGRLGQTSKPGAGQEYQFRDIGWWRGRDTQ